MGDRGAAPWINRVLILIVAFIGLHVVFVIFRGNPRNGIVQFVNSVARLFVLPFTGMFPNDNPRTARLIACLVAVLAYCLIAGIALAINRRIGKGLATREGKPPPGTPVDVDTTHRS